MEIYPVVHKKGSIARIVVKDVVTAVFLMASKAKEAGCGVIFFPEAGGLPLKYIFEHGVMGKESYAVKIFSSKITASTKTALSKQICGILSPAERRQHLTDDQIIDFKKVVARLSKSSKNELVGSTDINHLERLNLSEIIGKISGIGLYIPSEDKPNWAKAGIIPKKYNPNNYSPEDNDFEEFQNFRKKIIAYSLDRIPDITHNARPLLNIILSRTNFARAVHQNIIYVMDEAISRGRTLNVLEIIFKAFNKNAVWKIGVLFCPLDASGRGNIDFVLSSNHIPLFSNRFDLIGDIVVESDIAFARYNIDKLFLKRKKIISKFNHKQLTAYFKNIRQFIRRSFSDFLKPSIIDENDLIRLFHFIFVCNDMDILKRCINLNPMKISGLIEEVSFYINMPHPFDPMPIRKSYNDVIHKILEYFEKISPKIPIKIELQGFKRKFYSIKKHYELLELQCWSERYHNTISKVDSLLKYEKL